MYIIVFSLFLFVAAAIGFFVALWLQKSKIITLTDIYVPKQNEHENKIKQSCVLQLSNEIIKSGALKTEKLYSGKIRVTLKVIK